MGVKGGLKNKKIQDIVKMIIRNDYLQTQICLIHEYQEKAVGFKKNV